MTVSSVYGEHIRLSIFGQSHSRAIGMKLRCVRSLPGVRREAPIWVRRGKKLTSLCFYPAWLMALLAVRLLQPLLKIQTFKE